MSKQQLPNNLYKVATIFQSLGGTWVKLAKRTSNGHLNVEPQPLEGKLQSIRALLVLQVLFCCEEKGVDGKRTLQKETFKVGFGEDQIEFAFMAPRMNPVDGVSFVQPVIQFSHKTKNVKICYLYVQVESSAKVTAMKVEQPQQQQSFPSRNTVYHDTVSAAVSSAGGVVCDSSLEVEGQDSLEIPSQLSHPTIFAHCQPGITQLTSTNCASLKCSDLFRANFTLPKIEFFV